MTNKQLFDGLSKSVGFSESWVVSAMPRGGLQMVQPANLGGNWAKIYTQHYQQFDHASWRAIHDNRAFRGDDAFPGGLEKSKFHQDFLKPNNMRYLAVAPLAAPVLHGYPGALCILRRPQESAFNEQDLRALAEHAKQFDRGLAEIRDSRAAEDYSQYPWLHRLASRQLIFDGKLKLLTHHTQGFDARVLEQVQRDARQRISRFNVDEYALRAAFPDSNDNLWTFCIATFEKYPALGEGPFVFYGLEPDYADWQVLRATDLGADPEMARLVPAMQYMQTEFGKGPTLHQIAKHVHLSPFHFHRRFTELLGITPKHFLLAAQIFHTKKMLLAREKELVDIARICGFAHQSHFTSRFKQATGLTPTRWRRSMTALAA